MRKDKKSLCKGELKCDFINHNFDDVWNFWKEKELGVTTDLCKPIPSFRFSTSENIEDGYYWFIIDGYRFSHCWVEVIGWGENVVCQTGSYYFEKM